MKIYKFNYLIEGTKEIAIITDNSSYSGCSDFQIVLLGSNEVIYNSHNKKYCLDFMKNYEEIEINLPL